MRECGFCGEECDSSIGLSRELTTRYWGGKRNGNVVLSGKYVSFFCSERHRNDFLATGALGEKQARKMEEF